MGFYLVVVVVQTKTKKLKKRSCISLLYIDTCSKEPAWLRRKPSWPLYGKFPVILRFRRTSFVLCLHRNCVVQGVPPTQESLCEAPSCIFTSSSLHFCLSLSSHPLILTFTTHNSRCGLWGYCVPLRRSRAVWVLFFFFYLSYLFLRSGVALFHSPTQGITSLRGDVVDLVGSCTRSTVEWHDTRRQWVPKTDRSKHNMCLAAFLFLRVRLRRQCFPDIPWDGRNSPRCCSGLKM